MREAGYSMAVNLASTSLAGVVTDVKVLAGDAAEASVALTALRHGLAAARASPVATVTEVDDIDELLGALPSDPG